MVDRRGHPHLRKAFGIVMAMMLLVVMGRFFVGAASFFITNADAPESLEGELYKITGESCSVEQDAAQCCAGTCTLWCDAKNKQVFKAGVLDSQKMKCSCTCSLD